MATLYITEYARLARDGRGFYAPVGEEPAVTSQTVTYTTATASADLNKETTIVRLIADADFHLEVGTTPAPTASSPLYKANTEYFIGVLAEHVASAARLEIGAYDGTST